MGLFSKLGLGNNDKQEAAAASPAPAPQAPAPEPAPKEAVPEIRAKEAEYLIDRSYDCPICGAKFKSRGSKARVRMSRQDDDLRPVYDQIDPMKYQVILCPECGYAAHEKYFKEIYDAQKKSITQGIGAGFSYTMPEGPFTYEDAIVRYKQAIKCMEFKEKIKDSEVAYTYLRYGWTLRGKLESLDPNAADYAEKLKATKKEENLAIAHAYKGFYEALQKEDFPVAGMDQMTLTFLVAVLSVRFGKLDAASRMIAQIITSPEANSRLKDKARDMKEEILAKKKAAEQQ
ncbi:MAG: DUF2225 domain-containing protein [Lachnospiraceae bacterium]|nr:DUF2225 domain-containing protein [Lachnospiraceae bacterium]